MDGEIKVGDRPRSRIWTQARIWWYEWEHSNWEHLVARKGFELNDAMAERARCDDMLKALRRGMV